MALPSLTPLGWSFVRGRLTDPEQFAWEAVAALLRDCPDDPDGVADDAHDPLPNCWAPNDRG
ncbi:hypothetical protein ACFV23_28895, partial [Streptomyces sp. NPDC059627]